MFIPSGTAAYRRVISLTCIIYKQYFDAWNPFQFIVATSGVPLVFFPCNWEQPLWIRYARGLNMLVTPVYYVMSDQTCIHDHKLICFYSGVVRLLHVKAYMCSCLGHDKRPLTWWILHAYTRAENNQEKIWYY